MNRVWEFVGYVGLAGLILGQIVVPFNFLVGQLAYLIADLLILVRCFAIHQMTSDKVKNVAMTAICVGVLIAKIFC